MEQTFNLNDKFRVYTATAVILENEAGEEISVQSGDKVGIQLNDGRKFIGIVTNTFVPFSLALETEIGYININWRKIDTITLYERNELMNKMYMRPSAFIDKKAEATENEIEMNFD